MTCCKKLKTYIGYTQENDWYIVMMTNDLFPCECHKKKWFSLKPPFSLQEWLQQWKQCEDFFFQNKKIVWKTMDPLQLYSYLILNKQHMVLYGEII